MTCANCPLPSQDKSWCFFERCYWEKVWDDTGRLCKNHLCTIHMSYGWTSFWRPAGSILATASCRLSWLSQENWLFFRMKIVSSKAALLPPIFASFTCPGSAMLGWESSVTLTCQVLHHGCPLRKSCWLQQYLAPSNAPQTATATCRNHSRSM